MHRTASETVIIVYVQQNDDIRYIYILVCKRERNNGGFGKHVNKIGRNMTASAMLIYVYYMRYITYILYAPNADGAQRIIATDGEVYSKRFTCVIFICVHKTNKLMRKHKMGRTSRAFCLWIYIAE